MYPNQSPFYAQSFGIYHFLETNIPKVLLNFGFQNQARYEKHLAYKSC